MPLHLLGKKSWNVYNADNVARVRRDEAAAKAAEEAEEQRMQEIDAQRRLAILRGEVPPAIEEPEAQRIEDTSGGRSRDSLSQPGAGRRKRKRPGEDDTEFELRVAKERNEATGPNLGSERKSTSSAPIVDHRGHIDLFGSEVTRAHAEKNEEAEAESRKKKQSYEDQYTMRLSNAAGRDGLSKPWYSNSGMDGSDAPMKDVWGNADPKRKERDTQRIASSDPLAMMKQGASKVRQLNQERKKFQDERNQELKDMIREERHRAKRRHRHEHRSRDDQPSSRHEERRRRSRSRERSHRGDDEGRSRRRRSRDDERRRRRDSRSPDRERERERERHRRHHRRDDRHD